MCHNFLLCLRRHLFWIFFRIWLKIIEILEFYLNFDVTFFCLPAYRFQVRLLKADQCCLSNPSAAPPLFVMLTGHSRGTVPRLQLKPELKKDLERMAEKELGLV